MEVVKKLFDTTDLYAILKISQDKAADAKELKKAFFKAALATHPDKGDESEREERTQKFQVVKQIYDLLQDEDKRKVYDETGAWPNEEEFSLSGDSFGKVHTEDILNFQKTYLGSDEELDDVKKHYVKGKGDILYVFSNLFFANILDDEDRVQGMIDFLIETGKMKKLGKGLDPKARDRAIKKAQKEAKEAEEMKQETGIGNGNSLDALKLAMARNSSKRSGFLDDLEKKYAAQDKKGKSKDKAPKESTKSKPKKKRQSNEIEEEDVSEKPVPKKLKTPTPPADRVTRSRSNVK